MIFYVQILILHQTSKESNVQWFESVKSEFEFRFLKKQNTTYQSFDQAS